MTVLAVAAEVVEGSTLPRLYTPPLVVGPPGPCGCGCALTRDTSYGFGADDFARDTLLAPLDPWQRWAAIHAGELLPDGRPRFRRVIIVVARQSGKTHLLVVLTLYWLFVEQQAIILGTSTQTKYAMEPWKKAHELALSVEDLDAEIPRGRTRGMSKGSGREEWKTLGGGRYVVTPSNEEGGRSLSLNRVVADELAWQFNYGAYGAAYYAMRAVYDAQYFGLTTPLDKRSQVFNDFRKAALSYIETGEGDERLGLLEWSAPEGADPLDPYALAAANPNAVAVFDPASPHRPTMADLLNDARVAVAAGGSALIEFKANSMCIAAAHADPAIDAACWGALPTAARDGFDDLRGKVALVIDVAPGGVHVTLYAGAQQPDGRVRIGLVGEWDSTDAAVRALPGKVAATKARVVGFLPGADGAVFVADLADRSKTHGRRGAWPPPGVRVEEIRGEVTAVCMGFDERVNAGQIARIPDELLDAHVAAAERLKTGDVWRFSRRDPDKPVDCLYAAAGAVHLARTLPPGLGEMRILLPTVRDS